MEAQPGLLETVAESGPWGERVNLESQDQKEVWATEALVGRRATMGEMELAVKDAEAGKENEDSRGTQARREPLVSLGQTAHRDPKASEAAGEIQDLRGLLDRRETLATRDRLVTRAIEATPLINVP